MKITYEFVTGEVAEVEVTDEIGSIIIDSRREEESQDRKERRHCYSIDAILYEGEKYGTEDRIEALLSDSEENRQRVREAFSRLTEVQRRRLLLYAGGLSYHEIAQREGKNVRAIFESLEGARKKFLKFYR